MFPVIPVVCFGGIVASVFGLTWYESMSTSEKEEADNLAAGYAMKLYQTSIENLTEAQASTVASFVRNRLNN